MIRTELIAVSILFARASCKGRFDESFRAARWVVGPNIGSLDRLAVDFADEQTAWAVGEIDPGGAGGAIYQTMDGGRSWRPIARTNEILTSVHFVNLTTGWVAGHAGRIERTTDGGLTWRNERIEREGETLNSIFFIDERHGW